MLRIRCIDIITIPNLIFKCGEKDNSWNYIFKYVIYTSKNSFQWDQGSVTTVSVVFFIYFSGLYFSSIDFTIIKQALLETTSQLQNIHKREHWIIGGKGFNLDFNLDYILGFFFQTLTHHYSMGIKCFIH